MARSITNDLLQNILDVSRDGLQPLLTIDWNDGPHVGTLRLTVHDQNQVSNGQTFLAADFGVELPDEDENADVPMLRIVVQDVDRAVRTELRQLDTRFPAVATLQLALISNLDSIQQTFSGKIRSYKLTQTSLVMLVEVYEDISRVPVTPFKMSPAYGFHSLRGR